MPQAPTVTEPQIKVQYNHPALRNPSEWLLTAEDDSDIVVAYNNTTRDTFKGTIEEFNKILRG